MSVKVFSTQRRLLRDRRDIVDLQNTMNIYVPGVITPPGQVAAPILLPASGSYEDAFYVTIATATPGATIYYTVDGSTPTTLSPEYTAPVLVDANVTIKAFATLTDFTNSAVTTEVYTITGPTTFVTGWYGSSLLDDITGEDWDTALTSWSQTTANYNLAATNYAFPATIAAGGTAAGPYRYYIVADVGSPAAPAASGGFFVSFNLSPADLAGAAEGYPDTDANGWPYLEFIDLGVTYRIYRLLNALNGAFTLRVQQF